MNGCRVTKIRTLAVIAATIMLLSFFLSAFFILHEEDHDCCGGECHICAAVRMVTNALRRAVTEPREFISAAVSLQICAYTAAGFLFIADSSLVGKKIRLNN